MFFSTCATPWTSRSLTVLLDVDVLSDVHPSGTSSSLSSISSCSMFCPQGNTCRQWCSRHVDPCRRVTSLAVPWQHFHAQKSSTSQALSTGSSFFARAASTPSGVQTAQSFAPWPAPKSPRKMPSRQRLSAPIRLASLPVAIHATFCPNGATTRRKFLPSVERCSPVHTDTMPIDCRSLLNQPRQRVVILRKPQSPILCPAHTRVSVFWPSLISRPLQRHRFQEIGHSTFAPG